MPRPIGIVIDRAGMEAYSRLGPPCVPSPRYYPHGAAFFAKERERPMDARDRANPWKHTEGGGNRTEFLPALSPRPVASRTPLAIQSEVHLTDLGLSLAWRGRSWPM